MKAEPLPSSSTTPSTMRSPPSSRLLRAARRRVELARPRAPRPRPPRRPAGRAPARPRRACRPRPRVGLGLGSVAPLLVRGLDGSASVCAARRRRARGRRLRLGLGVRCGGAARRSASGLGGGHRPRRPARPAGLDLRRLASPLAGGLAGDDRVDQVGLAQAPEAVDSELVGDQVEVGERALLPARRDRGRRTWWSPPVRIGRHSGRVARSGRQPVRETG